MVDMSARLGCLTGDEAQVGRLGVGGQGLGQEDKSRGRVMPLPRCGGPVPGAVAARVERDHARVVDTSARLGFLTGDDAQVSLCLYTLSLGVEPGRLNTVSVEALCLGLNRVSTS